MTNVTYTLEDMVKAWDDGHKAMEDAVGWGDGGRSNPYRDLFFKREAEPPITPETTYLNALLTSKKAKEEEIKKRAEDLENKRKAILQQSQKLLEDIPNILSTLCQKVPGATWGVHTDTVFFQLDGFKVSFSVGRDILEFTTEGVLHENHFLFTYDRLTGRDVQMIILAKLNEYWDENNELMGTVPSIDWVDDLPRYGEKAYV